MARHSLDPIPRRLRASIATLERAATLRPLTARERQRHGRMMRRAESLRRAAYRRARGFDEPVTVASLAIEAARLACTALSIGGFVLIFSAFVGA